MSPSSPVTADRTEVEFPASAGFRHVGMLVLGGVASRFELPLDRVDDLLLAVESVLLQETPASTIRLEAKAAPTGLRVVLGSFSAATLADPSLRRVLDRLVDEIVDRPGGDETAIELFVAAAYRDGA
ncbi:MAG: hypothetical protein H0W16_03680 [Actinobacteria bacterium]|nr:hypothetical protein [Actinomycetota bacterium]